jgi:transposase InsO family protein
METRNTFAFSLTAISRPLANRCKLTCSASSENGYCESFNSKLRDELLAREIFIVRREAKILIEAWRQHYNTARPHSSLGYKPPAPKAFLPAAFMPPYYEEVAA